MIDMGVYPYAQWIASTAQVSDAQIEVIDVADGAALPSTIEAHGVIGSGSGHSAFEELPWIRDVKDFFTAAQERGVPELHICWSHQAKVMSAGGRVERGACGRKFGIEHVRLTAAGRRDALFAGMPDTFDMFTSHTDVTTRLPHANPPVELAYSESYPYEALAYGSSARTVQAHPEMTAPFITALANARREQLVEEGIVGPHDDDYQDFLDSLAKAEKKIRENGLQLMENWLFYFVGAFFLNEPPTASLFA
jgi:GMP synthase (glutamine-hydrolysing)